MPANAARVPGAKRRRLHTDIDRFVAHRIGTRRAMVGLTQQQLAGRVGVTFQQVHKYEAGLHCIDAGRLHQIATVLGVEVGYFFDDTDAPSFTPASQRRAIHLL
jgi:transcriptional regulator with XRE-family HTH domain